MSDNRTPKQPKQSKWKVSTRAPRAPVATGEANPGVEVSTAPAGPGQAGVPVYADVHQGKHIDGYWKDYDEGKGTVFLSRLASYRNTALLKTLADAIPWATVAGGLGGFDYMLECSNAVAADGETYVWIQGGRGKANGSACYSFHAIPTDDEAMVRKLKSRGHYQYLDISGLV